MHPDEFYLSYSRLQYIYKSDTFKELKYFSDNSEDTSFNIQCQQNLEFHNVSTSNEEIIERLKLVINDNLGKKNNTHLFR